MKFVYRGANRVAIGVTGKRLEIVSTGWTVAGLPYAHYIINIRNLRVEALGTTFNFKFEICVSKFIASHTRMVDLFYPFSKDQIGQKNCPDLEEPS